jgi:hypothetical protein
MSNLVKYCLMTAVGAGFLAGAIEFYKWRLNGRAEIEENSRLAEECMLIASGENRVLDSSEGVTLARDLGYHGLILPNENIILFQERLIGEKPKILIGYDGQRKFGCPFRTSAEITPEQLKENIARHNKK